MTCYSLHVAVNLCINCSFQRLTVIIVFILMDCHEKFLSQCKCLYSIIHTLYLIFKIKIDINDNFISNVNVNDV